MLGAKARIVPRGHQVEVVEGKQAPLLTCAKRTATAAEEETVPCAAAVDESPRPTRGLDATCTLLARVRKGVDNPPRCAWWVVEGRAGGMPLPCLARLPVVVTGTNASRGHGEEFTEPLPVELWTKRRRFVVETNGIRVRRVAILPQPPGAMKPFDAWSEALESLGMFILSDETEFTTAALEARMNTLLRLPTGRELEYNEVVTFLGHYIALAVMAINASGPPNASWGGPITNPRKYPAGRAAAIWTEVLRKNRGGKVREALSHVCPNAPAHPFYAQNGNRNGTIPFIDTMGGIIDMVIETGPPMPNHAGYSRDIMIATSGSSFGGHIFVTYANAPYRGVRALMPYGISRSAFFLPGTCAPPRDTSGFIQALFAKIDATIREIGITHAFTWPLAKMKERFLAMNWTLIPKNSTTDPNYPALRDAVTSIYGPDSPITRIVLTREFATWDFVMHTAS